MEAPSLAVLTAAPVTLKVDGKDVRVKPLGATVLGVWIEKLSDKRLSTLPSIGEVLRELKGLEGNVVREALQTLADLRREASEPNIDDLMRWITSDLRNMTGVMMDCIVDEDRGSVDVDSVFRAVVVEAHRGSGFTERWMEASGMMGNPT